jgi:hypothetical protein
MNPVTPNNAKQPISNDENSGAWRRMSAAELEGELAKMHRELRSEPDKYRASLLRAHSFRLEAQLEALRQAS